MWKRIDREVLSAFQELVKRELRLAKRGIVHGRISFVFCAEVTKQEMTA